MPTWWMGLADAPSHEAHALHALGLGFMAARTLHVALELRLFTHLATGAQTLTQIATVLGLAERAAGRLLHACAALGLVQATGEGFCNTSLTQKYLVEGRPTFIGSYLRLFDTLGYHRWEQMSEALRRNGPVDDLSHPYRYLADDAEDAAPFQRRSTPARVASDMRWRGGSTSRPLRVSSTWEVARGHTRWKSSAAIPTCAPSSSIFLK